MSSDNSSTSKQDFVIQYMSLRKAIGILGITLPFVLILGKIACGNPGIESSISDYYYTNMRDVFVGILCAIGIFMLSYKGHERNDDIAGNLACVFSVGVAWFPTAPELNPTQQQLSVGIIHYAFATAFFLTLSYFCLVLFRKTNPEKTMTEAKKTRNKVYATCGGIMLGCIVLLLINAVFLRDTAIKNLDPVFWLETLAIVAFGFSWLTKGEALWKDQE